MKKKRKNILLIAGMLLALLVGILIYSAYTQKQIYQESTANLLSTYGQSAKTFTMFAQRNWNILTDWDSYLGTLAELGEQEGQWQEYIAQKATWQYTDFYLFNEQCEFWTTAGRQGTAEHMKATFEELYTANAPVISSYTSSQGIRKVMFAMPMEQPLQLGDTTYTALAVSYDNAVLEKLLSSMVYEGQSDCYVVRSDGEVVLSTEVKTVIAELMTNLFDYLQQNASVDQSYFDTMVQTLPQGGEGCVLFTMNGQKYYLIYQPLGILDWGIIGIVPTGVVDAGMRRVQMATIFIIALLGLLIMAGVVKIQRDAERNRRKAALSAEITQEGIHRRLKPNSESCVSAVWKPSSKQPSLDPPPAALRLFPCAIKILNFQNFYKVLKTCSTGRKDFFDTLTQVSLCKSKAPECKHIPEQLP